LRRVTRSLSVLAALTLGLAGFFGWSGSAATATVLHVKAAGLKAHAAPVPRTKAEWQSDITHVRQPGTGCFKAAYPALIWHAVKCGIAPKWPMAPARIPRPAMRARSVSGVPPRAVGAQNDYEALAPNGGLITQATGTFKDVSTGITETGQIDGAGGQVANAFTLQMNSQDFDGVALCATSTTPANCQGWQQFIYDAYGTTLSSIYIQYWLINYTGSCPIGWDYAAPTTTTAGGCWVNSAPANVDLLTAKQLASVRLTASVTSGGSDTLSYTLGNGTATSIAFPDSKLGLAAHWTTAEWNVFGDAGGGEANFGAGTTLEPQIALTDTSGAAAPICSMSGTTAETNNLNLAAAPELGGESSPTASFLETSATSSSIGCSTVDGTTPSGSHVCDIYASDGTPCTAAYSMDRALYASYNGPLYQVKRASDGTTANIGLLAGGGDVKAATQDSFCANTSCIITEIYDQSPNRNNLTVEGAGGNGAADSGSVANALPITIGGNEAYGLDIAQGNGYRDDTTTGSAVGGEPESMYMVASGTNVNSGCCFDFGNAETNNRDNGASHMDAVNLTTFCGSYEAPCTGHGPWVEADMENGQYLGGGGSNPADTGNSSGFVTAMLANNGQTTFQLEGADAQSGSLTKYWDGPLPSGYSPMHQEGAIVLGTGGDNSRTDVGSFFEGVMTANVPSQAADDLVQANIVAAGYAGNSDPTATIVPSAAGQAVVHSAGASGAAVSGYSSVYTVNSATGDLQETYLTTMGAKWATQDLSSKYGTPTVMAGTEPVAIVHCGYTSVYTVDAASGDLQETYLAAIGDAWATHDLSKLYGTPPTNVTPTAVEHTAGSAAASPGCGYTSVYTRDRNGDLQETYLSEVGFPGDAWATQDLSSKYGTPGILAGTSPVAIVHCGYTSVYTVDTTHQLQETYLSAISASWSTQNLSANYSVPPTVTTPTAVVHTAGVAGASPGCGYTSVYTVDQGSNDLQETYLPLAGFPGDAWNTQNLSVKYGTPAVAPGTQPEALVHMDYTSVYTVDEGSNDLQETYLPAVGGAWGTQNLSSKFSTPTTDQSPIVLVHPDTSGHLDWTSVFTIDEYSNDLQETYLSDVGFPGDSWVTQNLTANYGTPEVSVPSSATDGWSVDHLGYTSVYTVNASNGHLDETYLSAMGAKWAVQDLSSLYGTPPVKLGVRPVAVFHDGYTSVYTVDASNGDLQETYLSNVGFPGDSWVTQDLSAKFGTPPSADVTPAAAFHDGYVSVYTVDASNGDLQETYLSNVGFPGDAWGTQDLSTKYGTPAVDTSTSPVAVVHDGYTSIYTIDASNSHLQETYLPYMFGAWTTQDLSANYGTPAVNSLVSPTAIVHDGYTSIYTVDASNGDLQETYLPAIGDAWATQNLSSKYGTPAASGFSTALLHYDTSGGLSWASVYTIDANGDVQETYLPNTGFPGDAWTTQNLSVSYGTPPV
jgi:hypothetical protein